MPDYVLETIHRKIGIELTEIFIDTASSKSSHLKENEIFRKKFGNKILEKLKDSLHENLEFSISFTNTFRAKGQKLEQDISAISDIVKSKLTLLKKGDVSIIKQNGQLPDGIIKINLFYGLNDEIESRYMETDGGSVPNLSNKVLKSVINKKEELLPKFDPCDDYWLLVKEGNFYAGGFNEISTTQYIESVFEKIFLVRTSRNEVVEIK
jgi:chaperonin cofactor prefoldin